MLKKLLSKSGRRILQAVKKFSTINRSGKKCQPQLVPPSSSEILWAVKVQVKKASSSSRSLASLDAKSIDTNLTLLSDLGDTPGNDDTMCCCCCCCCDEYEQNRRNENKENEMFS